MATLITKNLILPVSFDPGVTDIEAVSCAIDWLLCRPTPGILDFMGEIIIGETEISE